MGHTAPDSVHQSEGLRIKRLGIDTYLEPVVYMRSDCAVCRSEGFEARSRVRVRVGGRSIIATLNVVHDSLLALDEVGLSEYAWKLLEPESTDTTAWFSHPDRLESLRHVRAKIYGHRLDQHALKAIIADVAAGRYADSHLAAFITACGGNHLDTAEIVELTRAMISVGQRLSWGRSVVVDKHCIGGIPGNRTTPIVVSLVAANGLLMPKTSSRAITSPAGTADTMETLAPVELTPEQMRKVVEKEGACIAWGGAVNLSPADEMLIRVERQLELDSEGQLVASVLSKKAAAGSTHVVIDLPAGPNTKVRSTKAANHLANLFRTVGPEVGLAIKTFITPGTQPVGFGIGPALEARDILAVLRGDQCAPEDLRERALMLAGEILEHAGRSAEGTGVDHARALLNGGQAWDKFQAICEAQGGMRTPPEAQHRFEVSASFAGYVSGMDNRRLAVTAKLAGAPYAPSAGMYLYKKLGDSVEIGESLFAIHAESTGEMYYALEYYRAQKDIIQIAEGE